MDAITYPTSHDRVIKSATRKTGATTTTRRFEDGTTTFSAKNSAGKVVVSGKIDAAGVVKFATAPQRKPSKTDDASE